LVLGQERELKYAVAHNIYQVIFRV